MNDSKCFQGNLTDIENFIKDKENIDDCLSEFTACNLWGKFCLNMDKIETYLIKKDLFFQWKSARGRQRTEGAIFKCGIENATYDIVGCTLKVADKVNISEEMGYIAFGEIYEECICCGNNCYLGIEDRGNLPILC